MSSHIILTTFYYIYALEPSERHLADGWGLAKRENHMGYCMIIKTSLVSGTRKPLWLVAQLALRCKQPLG